MVKILDVNSKTLGKMKIYRRCNLQCLVGVISFRWSKSKHLVFLSGNKNILAIVKIRVT